MTLTLDDRLRNYARQNYGYLLRGADWDGDVRLLLECEGITARYSTEQERKMRRALDRQLNGAHRPRPDAELPAYMDEAQEFSTKPLDVTEAMIGQFHPVRGTPPWIRSRGKA